jgi:hypothetical protein
MSELETIRIWMRTLIMTNTRTLKSRNKREGWYAGKHRQPQPDKNWWEVKKRHRRTKYKDFGVGL